MATYNRLLRFNIIRRVILEWVKEFNEAGDRTFEITEEDVAYLFDMLDEAWSQDYAERAR